VHGRFLTDSGAHPEPDRTFVAAMDCFALGKAAEGKRRSMDRLTPQKATVSCHPKCAIVRLLATLSNHPLTIFSRIFFRTRAGRKISAEKERRRNFCRGKKIWGRHYHHVDKLFERENDNGNRWAACKK
jgi:hypothetical protein